MRKYDDRVSLSQMLEYARQARKMVTGFSRSDLDTNDMLRYATIYLIEVMASLHDACQHQHANNTRRYPGATSLVCVIVWLTGTVRSISIYSGTL